MGPQGVSGVGLLQIVRNLFVNTPFPNYRNEQYLVANGLDLAANS
jgi:hypothetical protein